MVHMRAVVGQSARQLGDWPSSELLLVLAVHGCQAEQCHGLNCSARQLQMQGNSHFQIVTRASCTTGFPQDCR
jgi:hypothetical protein